MATGVTHYDERTHLFTDQPNDKRGNLIGKALQDAPKGVDPAGYKDSLLYDVMMAKDYEAESKAYDMQDNDIHNEFMNVIILAAHYHRVLDLPSGTGTALGTIEADAGNYAKNILAVAGAPVPRASNVLNIFGGAGYDATKMKGSGGADVDIMAGANGVPIQQKIGELVLKRALFGRSANPGFQNRNMGGLGAKKLNDFTGNPKGLLDEIKRLEVETPGADKTVGGVLKAAVDTFATDAAGINGLNASRDYNKFTRTFPALEAQIKGDLVGKLTTYFDEIAVLYINEFYKQLNTTGADMTKVFGDDPGAAGELGAITDLVEDAHGTVGPALTTVTTALKTGDQGWQNLMAKLVSSVKAVIMPNVAGQYRTIAEPLVQPFYDKVIKNWDNLKETNKKFYRDLMQFRKHAPGDPSAGHDGHVVVSESDYSKSIPDADKKNYRINLKKTQPGGTTTIFETWLPKISGNVFGKLYYTNHTGNVIGVPIDRLLPDEQNILQRLYHDIYNANPQDFGIQAGGAAALGADRQMQIALNIAGAGVNFDLAADYKAAKEKYGGNKLDIKLDKLIRRRLFRVAKAKPTPSQQVDAPEQFSDIHHNVWTRDSSGNYYKTVGGKNVKYGVDDEVTVNLLKASHACYSTGLNKDGTECHAYIYECLLNDDADALKKCVARLSASDFQKMTADEINNMHPIIAYRTLQKFGFKKRLAQDSIAGQQLYKVQDVTEWLKALKEDKNMDSATVEKIANENHKIMHYLRHVVEFVNKNPSILNKDYSGATIESVGDVKAPELMNALKIAHRIEPKGAAESSYSMRIFGKSFDQLYSGLGPVSPWQGAQGFPFTTPFGGMSVTPNLPLVSMQSGGGPFLGPASDFLLRRYEGQHKNLASGGELIEGIFHGLINELGNRGKTLSSKDKDNIEKRISQLKNTEDNLIKLISYIEEYNKLLDATKDYSTQTISESELMGYVNKHGSLGQRQVKQEKYLLDIVQKIQKELASEVGAGDLEAL